MRPLNVENGCGITISGQSTVGGSLVLVSGAVKTSRELSRNYSRSQRIWTNIYNLEPQQFQGCLPTVIRMVQGLICISWEIGDKINILGFAEFNVTFAKTLW
jgi:hypothetical protein